MVKIKMLFWDCKNVLSVQSEKCQNTRNIGLWYQPVSPATQRAEAGGLEAPGLPGLQGKTLTQKVIQAAAQWPQA